MLSIINRYYFIMILHDDQIIIIIYSIISLISAFLLPPQGMTFIMIICLIMFLYKYPGYWKLCLSSFLIGAISDLLLNLYVHKSTLINSPRIKTMIYYFNKSTTIFASIFAGMLTLWMCLGTYIITELKWTSLITGFIIGVLWGCLCQNTKSFIYLYPFYMNTTGFIENRIWDGITITYAMFINIIIFKYI